MIAKFDKQYNNTPCTTFIPVGVTWSTYIPEGKTLKVYMAVDNGGNLSTAHYREIAQDSSLNGPNILQCTGFNEQSCFMITGMSINDELEILV